MAEPAGAAKAQGNSGKAATAIEVVASSTAPAPPTSSNVLAGVDPNTLAGDEGKKAHFGIAVHVSTDENPSTLVIPDLAGKKTCFITRPVTIHGKNLAAYLKKKVDNIPDAVSRLLKDTDIACDAFYYSDSGPLLMMFEINFTEGLIKDLTNDEDLGKLFDVHGASLRVLKCPKDSFGVLEKYVSDLKG